MCHVTARVAPCVRALLAATCTRCGTRGWQFVADIGCDGEGGREESCRLQSTLPLPLRVTLNKISGGLCSNLLCCLVAQPSTSTQGPLVEASSSLCILALFSHLNPKWPYSILAALCYGPPNNATLCMVSSGSSVHYDRTLQKGKEGTKHNRLTAFSTSFIDSTAENAEEMGLGGESRPCSPPERPQHVTCA